MQGPIESRRVLSQKRSGALRLETKEYDADGEFVSSPFDIITIFLCP